MGGRFSDSGQIGKSRQAGNGGVTRYLEEELRLPVNREKSQSGAGKGCDVSWLSDSQGKDSSQQQGPDEVQG